MFLIIHNLFTKNIHCFQEPFQKDFYVPHKNTKSRTQEDIEKYREVKDIIVQGDNVPQPNFSFDESSFPDYVMQVLLNQGFNDPTAIQAQGWPVVLSGRDLVGKRWLYYY